MFDLEEFAEFVNKINESNSRNYKLEVLKEYADNESVKYGLQYIFDPFIITGISAKKFEKVTQFVSNDFGNLGFSGIHNCYELFEYIKKHNTGRIIDLKMVASVYVNIGEEYRDLYRAMLTKNLNIGIDAKSINKVIDGLISQFSCMLAQKYFDKPEKLAGKTFAITTKLDGFRLIVLKDAYGNVKCYSRVGQLVEGLVEIEEELEKYFPNNFALDGELTVSNYFEMPSKDAYKAASKIISLKDDTPKTGLTYRVFDCMKADEFTAQKCHKTYDERRAVLNTFADRVGLRHIEVLPVLYRGNDTSKIIEWLDKIIATNGEGCMLNVCAAEYHWSRSWDIMKVKKFNSLDLEVIGVEEGSGRLAGTLGAVHVRYKGGNIVKVGSGFSDEERKLYFNNPELILHKICEIKYFEESTNADGTFSLRFPTWVSNIRDSRDKANPDF